MTCSSKLQNNIRNGFPTLDDPTKVISFMFGTPLVLNLLKCLTPDGGHLGFVQYGRHRGGPSWLPRKLVGDGHISPWSKNSACGTI